jgi:hypothetical protein
MPTTARNSNGMLEGILSKGVDAWGSNFAIVEQALTDRTVPDSDDGVNPTADDFFRQIKGVTIDQILDLFARVKLLEKEITPELFRRREIRVTQGYKP